jgi:hypothetical protein
MFKPLHLLVLVGLGLGAWYFFSNYRIRGLEKIALEPAKGDPSAPGSPGARAASSLPPSQRTIRIVSVNFGPLDQAKLARQQVAGTLVQVIRRFDVVALQDVQARDQGPLVQLVEQVNAQGRHYDFAVPPRVGRDPVRQYNAFVFDGDRVEIDRATIVSVDERSGQFRHAPLAAAFRARGPAESEAFTFALVNVSTPSDRVEEELPLLAGFYRAIRDRPIGGSGRREDDVILLGTLGTDDAHLGPLQQLPNATCAISGAPTTTRANRLVDNILFDRRATVEFTHRCGVLDLRREFNLTPQEELQASDHLPVWAEFSVFEGGEAGQVPGAR